jgi:hypothetical protein
MACWFELRPLIAYVCIFAAAMSGFVNGTVLGQLLSSHGMTRSWRKLAGFSSVMYPLGVLSLISIIDCFEMEEYALEEFSIWSSV